MTGSIRPVEIKALAGVRALPPLLLVLYHYCEGHGYRHAPWFDLIVGKGYLWVEFFFALSGFILIHVYGTEADRFRPMAPDNAYWSFLRNRLIRLYPLHLFTLFCILALVGTLNQLSYMYGYVSIYNGPWPPMHTASSFIASIFLVQGWNLFPWLTWNEASWFVSAEFFLCLCFPLYVLWAKDRPTGNLWRGFLLLILAISALAGLSVSNKHGLDLTFHNGVLRGIADFAAGTALAMLYREAHKRGAGRLSEWIFTVAQLVSLSLLLWSFYGITWAHGADDYKIAGALFLFIFVLSFDRGILALFFKSAPLRKLGEWSYAIYMGQTFCLHLFRYFSQKVYPPGETILFGQRFGDILWRAEPLMLLITCILWGALLYYFVEVPATGALKRLFTR